MENFDPKYKSIKFEVPDTYFENLEDKIMSQIRQETNSKPKSIYRIGRPLAIAASLAILVVITILSYRSASVETETISFNDLDSIDIANFESQQEFSDEEFEEYVPSAVIDSLYYNDIESNSTNTFISTKELEELEEEYSILDDEIEI
ncbi:MAG: hypothetical protein IT245_07605 [Bacteroidia bacterium]|nr:hypothetical protein [Bacteroidia bacterium]